MKRAPAPRRPISTSSPLLPSRSRMRLAASRGRTMRRSVTRSPALAAHHAEEMARHLADLDLLGAFGDAIAAVMAIDMLEGLVPGITHAAMDLDREIGRLAGEAIAAVIRHRNPIAHFEMVLAVEMPSRLVDEVAHHLAFRVKLGEWPLDRLVGGERLAEDPARAGIFDALIDAVLRDADARCRLADAVLMDEMLGHDEALALAAQDAALRHAHILERHLGMVARHGERPPHELDLEAGGVRGHEKSGDPQGIAFLSRSPCEDKVDRRGVEPRVEALGTVDDPVGALAPRVRLHPGGVRAVIGFGQAEGDALTPGDRILDERLLLGRAVFPEQMHHGEVADDRAFILKIVVEAQPLMREMLADDGHGEIRAILSAQRLGEREAQMPE